MFNLFKNKYKNINEYPETWGVIRNEYEGSLISIRLRIGLKEAIGHPDYPYLFSTVAIIKNPNENGQPSTSEEEDRLFDIEEYLIKILTEKDEAVFAFITTVKGQRQYCFYTKNGTVEYMKEKASLIEKEFSDYEFQFENGKDPDWVNLKVFLQ